MCPLKMVIFHSYGSLPEDITEYLQVFENFPWATHDAMGIPGALRLLETTSRQALRTTHPQEATRWAQGAFFGSPWDGSKPKVVG